MPWPNKMGLFCTFPNNNGPWETANCQALTNEHGRKFVCRRIDNLLAVQSTDKLLKFLSKLFIINYINIKKKKKMENIFKHNLMSLKNQSKKYTKYILCFYKHYFLYYNANNPNKIFNFIVFYILFVFQRSR